MLEVIEQPLLTLILQQLIHGFRAGGFAQGFGAIFGSFNRCDEVVKGGDDGFESGGGGGVGREAGEQVGQLGASDMDGGKAIIAAALQDEAGLGLGDRKFVGQRRGAIGDHDGGGDGARDDAQFDRGGLTGSRWGRRNLGGKVDGRDLQA